MKVNLLVETGWLFGICQECQQKVGWYKPKGQVTKICEHKNKEGKKCVNSKKPLTEMK